MTFRTALIGAGAMGTIMARDVYPGLADRIEVVAVIDRHEDRRTPLADALGATAYASLTEALATEELDGVDIRLQHAAHADAAVAALEAGLHVLVEKPLAITPDDCRRIATTSAAAGRTVAVTENYPHLHAVRAAHDAVAAGRVGEVLAIRTTRAYTLDGVWAETSWRQGADPMAGLLWDQGTHHTSLLRAIAGDVVAVTAARTGQDRSGGAETVTLGLRFASGLIGQSLYCWGTPMRPVETECTVFGSAGSIDVTVAYDAAEGGSTLVEADGRTRLSGGENYYDSHRAIVEDWLDAIATGREPRVSASSATGDVAVILAAQESLRRDGDEVRVEAIT